MELNIKEVELEPESVFIRFPVSSLIDTESERYSQFMSVIDAVGHGGMIAGGAVRRLIAGGDPLESDIDYFFVGDIAEEEFRKRLPDWLGIARDGINSSTWEGKWNDEICVEVNTVSISYHETFESLLDSFDFTCCMFGLDGDRIVTTPQALWDLARRRISVHRITYPAASLRRLIKYTKQGFYACDGCLKTFLKDIVEDSEALRNLDVKYID